jgi:hypothetical protein
VERLRITGIVAAGILTGPKKTFSDPDTQPNLSASVKIHAHAHARKCRKIPISETWKNLSHDEKSGWGPSGKA